MAFTLHTLLKCNAELYLYALLAGFNGTRTTRTERSQDRKTDCRVKGGGLATLRMFWKTDVTHRVI
jgi:hypothetical protein